MKGIISDLCHLNGPPSSSICIQANYGREIKIIGHMENHYGLYQFCLALSVFEDENGLIGNIQEQEVSIDIRNRTSKPFPDYAMPRRLKSLIHERLYPCVTKDLLLAISSCVNSKPYSELMKRSMMKLRHCSFIRAYMSSCSIYIPACVMPSMILDGLVI
jgi:hypothetical protein